MQETKVVDDKFPFADFAEIGYSAQVCGQASYNGVAILSKIPCEQIQRGFPDDSADAQARLLGVTIGGFRILNVYIPNGQAVGSVKYEFKLAWMKRLRTFFDSHYSSGERVVLCGDFNVAPEDRDVYDPELWRGKIMCSEGEREALGHIKDWGFVDAYRLHQSEAGNFSWWDYRAGAFRRNRGLRIDHVWVSEPLKEQSQSAWIDKQPRTWERPSDHAPVVADLM
jgi:exodeoxyribonuclease III